MSQQLEKLAWALRESRRLKKVRADPRNWRIEAQTMIYEISAAAASIVSARDWGGDLVFRNDPGWVLLRAVERTEGSPSISDLGRMLRVSRQAARRLVVKAARAGLIDLVTNPTDHRIIQVGLTAAARAGLVRVIRQRLVRNATRRAQV